MGETVRYAVRPGDPVLFFDGISERVGLVVHDHGDNNVLNIFVLPDGVKVNVGGMELQVPHDPEPFRDREPDEPEPGLSWRQRLP